MQFSKKIKICRQENKLTQEQFADSLNVSRKTVSGWENGRSFPDIITLVKISDIYDISLDNLLKDSNGTVDYYQSQIADNLKIQRRVLELYLTLLVSFVLALAQYLTTWKSPYHIATVIFLFSLVSYLLMYPAKFKFKTAKSLLLIIVTFLVVFLIYSFGVTLEGGLGPSASGTYYDFGYLVGAFFSDFLLSFTTIILIFFAPKKISIRLRKIIRLE